MGDGSKFGGPDSTFGPQHSQQVRSPVPLSKQVGESYPIVDATSGVRSQPDAMVDMDGDGNLDFVHLKTFPGGGWVLDVHRWDGNSHDPAYPVAWVDDNLRVRPLYISSHALTDVGLDQHNDELATLIDIGGDGLPDIVDRDPSEAGYRVLTNTGSDVSGGFMTGPLSSHPNTSLNLLSGTTVRDRVGLEGFRDIDGDGRPDRFDPLGYHFSVGQGLLAGSQTNPAAGQSAEIGTSTWQVTIDRFDLDGDGVADKITRSGSTITAELASVAGQPRGLMKSVDNGRGLVVDVKYASSTDGTIVTIDPGDLLPSPMWVVSEITATHAHAATNLSAPPPATSSYRYHNPVRNQDLFGSWGFRGFQSVESFSPSGARTEERFDYDLDWSGRKTATLIYQASSATRFPSTIRFGSLSRCSVGRPLTTSTRRATTASANTSTPQVLPLPKTSKTAELRSRRGCVTPSAIRLARAMSRWLGSWAILTTAPRSMTQPMRMCSVLGSRTSSSTTRRTTRSSRSRASRGSETRRGSSRSHFLASMELPRRPHRCHRGHLGRNSEGCYKELQRTL